MAMKESGIEWVGLIPDDWKIAKNNRLFNISKQLVNENWKNTQLLSLTKGGIIEKNINDGGGKQPESFGTYQYVEKDDIVLCLFDIDVSAVFSDRSKYDGMISPAYRVMKCTDAILPVYAKWWFDAVNIGRYYLIYTKSLRKTIDADGFGNILTVVPPLSEQQAIADYLDETCSKIDEIIAEAKASIDEYENLRQSIICEILTKGLDNNVEMKDSSVEWIGKVPSHWMIGKVKYGTTKVGSGKTPKGGAEVYTTSGVMFLRSQNIYNDGLRLDNPYYISEEIDEEMKNTRVQKNDVLLNITGGSIGRCCIFDGSIPNANVNQHVCIIRVDPVVFLPEYMHLFWISPIGQISIKLYQTGGNREGMSAEAIKNTPIPIISIAEQRRIVDFIKPKIEYFNVLIAEKESLINDLEAYKKSLIYEVVTGKRRVV